MAILDIAPNLGTVDILGFLDTLGMVSQDIQESAAIVLSLDILAIHLFRGTQDIRGYRVTPVMGGLAIQVTGDQVIPGIPAVGCPGIAVTQE